ncbi:BCCT family transporter [Thioalkalivibrio sulfidiphilus]|uniref:BCCT family transporter n=1 Tax=Thioalkalivibrio sulfidiphilus TaxID=1033854 RepID=UPI0026A8A6C1
MSDAKQADPQPRARINPPVFYASAILALAFVLYAVVFTESAAWLFTSIHEWVTHSAGWFYILSVALFPGVRGGHGADRFRAHQAGSRPQ